MRVLVAGASGAIGQQLVPMLRQAGHEVVATTRSRDKAALLTRAGAASVVMDALDRESVHRALVGAAPQVVIHQLTALTGAGNFKKFDQDFSLTNRLRTEGLDNLLNAAREAGAKRFIVQSYTGWPNARGGVGLADESDPLDEHPAKESRITLEAIRYLEQVVPSAPEMDGIALRYGTFYGPGTSLGTGGSLIEMVRRRKVPIVGSGAGVWSFVQIADAAAATAAAVDRGAVGIYNIVDDQPAPVTEWLPLLARAVGGKAPLHIPAWLAKPMIGELGLQMMTQMRGSSNSKARRELGWTLRYPSWRVGFLSGLG
jgi:nucleoside-diphosphate-sugar epimerase